MGQYNADLRRGEGLDLVPFPGDDDGAVGLQVEVLLAAHARLPLDHVVNGAAGELGVHVAQVDAVPEALQATATQRSIERANITRQSDYIRLSQPGRWTWIISYLPVATPSRR